MALDHSRLGLENKFLENKSGRIFLRSTGLLYKFLPTNLGVFKPTFYNFYTSHLRWNSTIYHTDLGQNAVFHNFSRQVALSQYSGRSIDSPHLEYLNLTQEAENCFVLQKTDVATGYSLLSKISQSKATGLDLISVRLLRECVDLIAPSLSVPPLITVLSLEFFLMIGNVPKLFFFSNKANAMTWITIVQSQSFL